MFGLSSPVTQIDLGSSEAMTLRVADLRLQVVMILVLPRIFSKRNKVTEVIHRRCAASCFSVGSRVWTGAPRMLACAVPFKFVVLRGKRGEWRSFGRVMSWDRSSHVVSSLSYFMYHTSSPLLALWYVFSFWFTRRHVCLSHTFVVRSGSWFVGSCSAR